MNNQYLSFWQNTLSDVFNTGKQAEMFNGIFSQTLSQFEEMSSFFNRLSMPGTSDIINQDLFTSPMEMNMGYYMEAIRRYMELFGLVSIDEYRKLVDKYEELQKEKQQSETRQKQQVKKTSDAAATIDAQKEKIDTYESNLKTIKKDLQKEKNETSALKKEIKAFQKTIADLEKKVSQQAAPSKAESKSTGSKPKKAAPKSSAS